MDLCRQMCTWPTVVWVGMIAMVGATLTVLTLTDNKPCPWFKKVGEYFDLQSEARKKTKKGKR